MKKGNKKRRRIGQDLETAKAQVRQDVLDFAQYALRFYNSTFTLFDFQKAILIDPSTSRATEKSRQIGFSFGLALAAIVRAHLLGINAVFVSYNQRESRQKIEYARGIWECLPEDMRLKMDGQGTKEEIRFVRGRGKVIKLTSFPCRPARGPTQADLYLDEMTMYRDAEGVYSGSIPVVSQRADAKINVCASPLGKRGMFYDIMRNMALEVREAYREFKRYSIPWWRCPLYLNKSGVAIFNKARNECPSLKTIDRLDRFGNEHIKKLQGSLPLDLFQQEYECNYLDETYAYFPYDLLEANTVDGLPNNLKFEKDDKIYGGYDFGDIKDPSALWLWKQKGDKFQTVYRRTFSKWSQHKQRDYLAQLLIENPQIVKLSIDTTDGGGRGLAKELKTQFGSRIHEVTLYGEKLDDLFTAFKMKLERHVADLPKDRDVLNQFHCIKKSISAAGRAIYKAERSRKGHADEAYAAIMAFDAINTGRAQINFFDPFNPSKADKVKFEQMEKEFKERAEKLKEEQEQQGETEGEKFERIMNTEKAWN